MKRLKDHIDKKLSGVKMDYVLSDTILDKTVYAQENSVRKKAVLLKKQSRRSAVLRCSLQ